MSLYQERRFAKLGYVSGSILDAMDLLQILLNEAHTHNLHTETVQIFLDCEFFSTSSAVLSYFSYHVSLPLLNCVEKAEQDDLVVIFPQLYTDLKAGRVSTLKDYVVRRHHYQVRELTSDAEKLLLNKFCQQGAAVIKLQCGREYFPGETATKSYTDIFSFSGREGRIIDPQPLT